MKGDDTVSGLKSCNILGFATILCDKFILAGEFLKGMIMKDDLSLHSSGTILLSSNTTAFHTALQVNLLFTVDLFKKAEVKLGRGCLFIGLAMTVSVIWHAMNKNGGKK